MHNAFFKLIVLVCIVAASPTVVSQQLTIRQVDSLSWKYFQEQNWDALIRTGREAHREQIDFKWLRQRLGYAWLMKGNYYKSKQQYRYALAFDEEDEISRLYLYFTNRATGHHLAARYHASRLPVNLQTQHSIPRTRWLNSLDAEYSYKRPEAFFRDNDLRGDGSYRRIGLHSFPAYRLSVYQSLSGFQQSTEWGNFTHQLEYMGSIHAQVTAALTAQVGYRYVGSRYTLLPDSFYLPGQQLAFRLEYQLSRFDLALSASRYSNNFLKVGQWGAHWGVGFSLPTPIYLRSAVFLMQEAWADPAGPDNPHIVFNQTLGAMLWKNRLWAELSATMGNQNYFTSADGMYFYNALDPVRQRFGAQLTVFINQHLSASLHYGLEKKYIYLLDEHYYQQALTGGIVWIL